MKITKATFFTSVANANNLINYGVSQIAFVGRSNVGKSSLINLLTNNSKLCKTSSTPGRTRLVNYFKINDQFYFVDLPGYGYAKASGQEIIGWQSLIEPYLINNQNLKLVCALVDSRIEPTENDKIMINFLNYYRIPFVVVATKCDKFAKSKIKPALNKLANSLKLGVKNVYGISSSNGYGKEELLSYFEQMLNN